MWIYEQKNWPSFKWDLESLRPKLMDVRYKQGKLLGRMDAIGLSLQQEATLQTLTNDVIKSSAIEGEILHPEEVRSSIARQLGMDIGGLPPTNRDVEGIVSMMMDATQHYQKPLTAERLFGWHAALFPNGRSSIRRITVGAWRPSSAGAMQVVSGPVGKETIHFEAPTAAVLDHEMDLFLKAFEGSSSIDPLLKAGLMHFWFVTIHPFEDGNGRIARAIGDMALAQAEGTLRRFYSLSSQIEMERQEYYRQLEHHQRGNLDVTGWLMWFLACLERAIDHADLMVEKAIDRTKRWYHVNQYRLNDRQRHIIHMMLGDFKGHMNTSKYAQLAKCSTDTALRDIQNLVNHSILVQNPQGGRSTSYQLITLEEIENPLKIF